MFPLDSSLSMLHCSLTWYVTRRSSPVCLSSSLIFGGWLISSVFGGFIADKFGRKVIMIVFMFLCPLFGFLSAFPDVYWLFALFRLLAGMSIGKATVIYLRKGGSGKGDYIVS